MIVRIRKENEFKKTDLIMPWSIFPLANISFYGLNKHIFHLYKTGNCFFSKYDDSIQVCSVEASDNELNDICSFILRKKIRMITAEPSIALGMTKILDKFSISFAKKEGYVVQINLFDKCDSNRLITAKEKHEFKNMVDIVCRANSDNPYFYQKKQLLKQYYKRSKSGYCRNFYIKEESLMVGTISTYCETDSYCVIGGLAVDPLFQKKGFGKLLFLGTLNKLNDENKKIFLFCYKPELLNFYSKYSNAKTRISKILVNYKSATSVNK